MQMLQQRIHKLNDDIIGLFCSGKGSQYSNKDLIELKPGTLDKLNKMLAQRNLLIDLIKEANAGNISPEEEKVDANPTGVVE